MNAISAPLFGVLIRRSLSTGQVCWLSLPGCNLQSAFAFMCLGWRAWCLYGSVAGTRVCFQWKAHSVHQCGFSSLELTYYHQPSWIPQWIWPIRHALIMCQRGCQYPGFGHPRLKSVSEYSPHTNAFTHNPRLFFFPLLNFLSMNPSYLKF